MPRSSDVVDRRSSSEAQHTTTTKRGRSSLDAATGRASDLDKKDQGRRQKGITAVKSQHSQPDSVDTPRKRQKSHSGNPTKELQQPVIQFVVPSQSGPSGNGMMEDPVAMSAEPDGTLRPLKKPWASKHQPNFQPRAGAKRLTIKNLKEPKVSPKEAVDKIWTQTEAAIMAVFKGEQLQRSYEQLYRDVQTVCRYGEQILFVERLREHCVAHVRNDFEASVNAKLASTDSSVEVLRSIIAAWETWNEQMATITRIFYYLDRSFLLHSAKYPTINVLRVETFRKYVLRGPDIRDRTWSGMNELYNSDREKTGDSEALNTLSKAVALTLDLDVYESAYEPHLMHHSDNWFNDWAKAKTSGLQLGDYLSELQLLFSKEQQRCETLQLPVSTRTAIVDKCRECTVTRQAKYLTNTDALSKLLDAQNVELLQPLYFLLKESDLRLELRQPWFKYIKQRGSLIIADDAKGGEMIVRLLKLKTNVEDIRKKALGEDYELGIAVREAFATFINERKEGAFHNVQTKVGELIAKYIDMLLRGGVKAVPSSLSGTKSINPEDDEEEAAGADEDAELSYQLDRVLDLFRFIEGKDVFEAFYKKDLARRLLMGRSASNDAERSMLARLHHECGASFTHNLETMFKDVDLAKDEMASYKEMQAESGKSDSLDLSVNVLSSSAWPTYPDVPVNIPFEVATHIEKYDSHYKNKHTGRRLQWKHALAQCVLKARFDKGNKEIVVSSFQAIVMLLFNDVSDGDSLGYPEIKAATDLSDVELKRTLQSLACAKYRVLTKHPKGRDVNDTDKFTVDRSFTDIKYRIKINQIQLKETKEENKATHEDITRDRQYETQAAIVRIMKSRKTITSAELQAETFNATKKRGVLSPTEIKDQIEKLIDKDYIEREMKESGPVYTYLA